MKKKILWASLLLVLLVVPLVGGSFSWFLASATASTSAEAGSIQLTLEYEPEQEGDAGGFVLENTGTLGTCVRLWYSFQYTEGEQPLLWDVSSIEFAEFSLERQQQAQPFRFALGPHTAGGKAQEKTFLLPLNEDGHYYFMQPGDILVADYALSGVNGDGLQVTWVAEAIQASDKALADAEAYGWDAEMAGR